MNNDTKTSVPALPETNEEKYDLARLDITTNDTKACDAADTSHKTAITQIEAMPAHAALKQAEILAKTNFSSAKENYFKSHTGSHTGSGHRACLLCNKTSPSNVTAHILAVHGLPVEITQLSEVAALAELSYRGAVEPFLARVNDAFVNAINTAECLRVEALRQVRKELGMEKRPFMVTFRQTQSRTDSVTVMAYSDAEAQERAEEEEIDFSSFFEDDDTEVVSVEEIDYDEGAIDDEAEQDEDDADSKPVSPRSA